jgi:hypothetical protein
VGGRNKPEAAAGTIWFSAGLSNNRLQSDLRYRAIHDCGIGLNNGRFCLQGLLMSVEALRAFIQRSETRLATMHATLSAFIGGAGLLTLFPLFFYNSAIAFVRIFEHEITLVDQLRTRPGLFTMLWLWPIICSFAIPLISLYQLVFQMAITYFDPQTVTFRRPRFSLRAIAVASDEHQLTDNEVYSSDNLQLVVPANELARPEGTPGAIDRAYVQQAIVAGQEALTLQQQAAQLQAHLIRLNVSLRVIIVRYIKSLIAFVWTLIALTICLAVVEPAIERPDVLPWPGTHPVEYWCLIFGLLWASLAPLFVALPLRWIIRRGNQGLRLEVRRDMHLMGFELTVWLLCFFAVVFSCVGLYEYEIKNTEIPFIVFTWIVVIAGWIAILFQAWRLFVARALNLPKAA